MNSEELDTFVRDMLAEKNLPGIADVEDEVQDQLVADLKERLLDQVDRAVIEALPDDKVDEFSALLDKEDTTDEMIQNLIAESGVDVQKVTTDAMIAFRQLYVASPQEREDS